MMKAILKNVFQKAAKPAAVTAGLAVATVAAAATDHSGYAALGGAATVLSGGYTVLQAYDFLRYRK